MPSLLISPTGLWESTQMRKLVTRFLRNEDGATAIEYAPD
jgi:hypothetical protein